MNLSISTLYQRIYKFISRKVLLPSPSAHFQPSIICSPEGTSGPNDYLMELATNAINLAWSEGIRVPKTDLSDSHYYNSYPGEHYRLLKAIVKLVAPKSVVEIGTYTGMGTVAMSQGLEQGMLYTFDIIPWHNFESHLDDTIFSNGNVLQILADLSVPSEFSKHFDLLNDADIIFLDAPKDGVFEYKFLGLLKGINPRKNRLMIVDDIRFVNMINFWRDIENPKLDLTSFGHWSGTGIVDLSDGVVVVNQ